jgi:hypothetical protein
MAHGFELGEVRGWEDASVRKDQTPTATRRGTLLGAAAAGLAGTLPAGALAAETTARGGSTMAADLTGGLDVSREYVFAEPPKTEGMRDAVNFWIWDDRGEVGFPRAAVEAAAPEWANHDINLNLTFADGRILRNWTKGPAHPVIGPGGKPTLFGAGPMAFECVEPFRRYRTTYKGDAVDTTFPALFKGPADTRRTPLEYEIEFEAAVPPWVQGAMSADAQEKMAKGVEGEFMGGERLEQLCRAKGWVRVDGGETKSFTGGALRVRRQGVRRFEGFWGHCWQSALFPSGKGFGYIAYPPRPDGSPSYNEGYLFLGEGELIPARVVEAPWLTRLEYKGQDLSMVFESRLGRTRIEGELVMAAPTVAPDPKSFPPLLQSIGKFSWDGETAYGMTERSNLAERITNLA